MPQEEYRKVRRRPAQPSSAHGGRRVAPSHPEGERRSAPRRRKKRLGGWGVLLYVIFVLGISALLAGVGWIWANDVLALNKPALTAVVEIDEGDTVGQVADKLEEQGLIEYKMVFKLFCSLTHTSGKAGEEGAKITPGTYELNTDMDYRALISGMSANSAAKATVKVTIPEGYSIDQIFALLEERGVVSDTAKLEEEAANPDYAFSFLQDLPLGDYHRLEGYLYPDTYEFTTPQNPLYVINKMLVRFDAKLTEELRQQIADSGRTIHEVLTVASLIEKETDGADRADIASVIYNRLNNPNSSAGTNGYLQIDATLAYLNGGKVPTEADKSIDSPYNTYLYPGLPPGPISNPGIESILAAINPNSTSYYYYVLGDDNCHHFFNTYREMQNFMSTQAMYSHS